MRGSGSKFGIEARGIGSETVVHASVVEKRRELVAACERYGVARLDIFGSALRSDDFDPDFSDVDFLVDFSPPEAVDAYMDLKERFETILGRRIDLID